MMAWSADFVAEWLHLAAWNWVPIGWFLAGMVAVMVAGCAPALQSVHYPLSDETLPNPERGLYWHADTHASHYQRVHPQQLRAVRQKHGITLVYRGFILDDFVHAPISNAFLDSMAADFAAIRQAGMKAIVRFAYTDSIDPPPGKSWPPVPPYGDADLQRILTHIEQLEPLLRANADVIAVVQAGFIGIWGEWYYTDHFSGAKPGVMEAHHWDARRQVVMRLLQALPSTHAVQVRTPRYKRIIIGSNQPLNRKTAGTGRPVARIGLHNDCFLGSETDMGTYDDLKADFAYLEADTRYVPVGGETCQPNPPRSACPNPVVEMERLHWSFLNARYHPDVLDSWRQGGCMEIVERRLGYRLALTEARYAPVARRGGVWRLRLDLLNTGFAAPYLPRGVEVVLRHRDTGSEYRADLGVDLRRALPQLPRRIQQNIQIPGDMPAGRYTVLVHLADPAAGLASRAEYAVRLANPDLWEPETGYNRAGFDMEVVEGRVWWSRRATTRLRAEAPPLASRDGTASEEPSTPHRNQ